MDYFKTDVNENSLIAGMTRCWSIHREITDGRTEGGAAGRVDNAYVGLTLIPVIDRLQVHWQVWADSVEKLASPI